MATAAQMGPGGVDANGRPVFIAADERLYTPTEKRELTDAERYRWRTFELWRRTNAMIRRDDVYKAVTQHEYIANTATSHILGTPYPIIESQPTFDDVLRCMRWYEHLPCILWVGYMYSRSSTPAMANRPILGSTLRMCYFAGAVLTELSMSYRSMLRLQGFSPNDYEANRYGVMETRARLEQKREWWSKYALYKKEWIARWDFYMWGMRPGEEWSLWSPCFFPSIPIRYGTKVDYPLRKNPMWVTDKPLRTTHIEGQMFHEFPRDGSPERVPLYAARPEAKYIYRGPLGHSLLGEETYPPSTGTAKAS